MVQAQQGDRMRRIGVLLSYGETDPEPKIWLSRFTQGLAELGWTDGRNLRMDVRWAASNVERMGIFAKELVALQPDAILGNSTPATAALQRETRRTPIVFAVVTDPVDPGFVASLSRPGGNITGFIAEEESIGGKLLQLLTEIAPGIKRVAAMFNPDTAPGGGSFYLRSFETAARTLNLTQIVARVHSDAEVQSVIVSLGRESGGGLVVMGDSFMTTHRASIISLAARNNVPAVYYATYFVRDGGLVSYGPDFGDIYFRAATYVDRILRGAKPAELPVQLPTKFEMAVNLKTAKALGLTVPQSILLRADEVIE
jgi:putative ABC transport system substrate-binding protein